MSRRFSVLLCGAAGLVPAALFYWVAVEINGALRILLDIPDANIVVFLTLLAISLLEIALVMYVLARFAMQLSLFWLCVLAGGYVAFAGVYALVYGFFVPDLLGMQVLAAFAVVRWFTLWFLPLR